MTRNKAAQELDTEARSTLTNNILESIQKFGMPATTIARILMQYMTVRQLRAVVKCKD